jgi:hypothetical protein
MATVTDPLLPPLQEIFAIVEAVAMSVVGWVIVVAEVAVQPWASVTITV